MLVVVGVLGQLSLVMQKRIEGKEDYNKASKARCVAGMTSPTPTDIRKKIGCSRILFLTTYMKDY